MKSFADSAAGNALETVLKNAQLGPTRRIEILIFIGFLTRSKYFSTRSVPCCETYGGVLLFRLRSAGTTQRSNPTTEYTVSLTSDREVGGLPSGRTAPTTNKQTPIPRLTRDPRNVTKSVGWSDSADAEGLLRNIQIVQLKITKDTIAARSAYPSPNMPFINTPAHAISTARLTTPATTRDDTLCAREPDLGLPLLNMRSCECNLSPSCPLSCRLLRTPHRGHMGHLRLWHRHRHQVRSR